MEFKAILANAQAALKNKAWQEAAEAWEAVLDSAEGRDSAEYLLKGARSMRLAGRNVEAETYISKAIEMSPDQGDILAEAARISAAAGDWGTSAARWDRMAALTTDNRVKRPSGWVTSVINRAHAHQMLGDFTRSVEILNEESARGTDTIALRNAKAAASVGLMRDAHIAESLSDVTPVPKIDIPSICQCFWDAEERFELAQFAIDGVRVWPLIRMQTYYRLTQLAGIYDAPHPNHAGKKRKTDKGEATQVALARLTEAESGYAAGSITAKVAHLVRRLFGGHKQKKSPFTEADIAVLMATRKVRGEELYTLALRQEAGNRALLLDRGQGEEVKKGAIDFDALVGRFSDRKERASEVFLSIEERLVLEGVRAYFERRLNLDLGDLILASQKALVLFQAIRQGFVSFWRSHPVERFFLTNAYGVTTRAAMVAAQDCGIRTIELQHGFISQYHLGYSWPNQADVPYVPDELWGFGDYWTEVTPLAPRVIPRTIGAPYVTDMARKTKVKRNPDLVVFTSQGVVGRQLVEWAIATAERRPDKEIVYRLHPSELLESYQQQTERSRGLPSNFSFSHRQPVIFELLAQSDIQVGAFSTTLLEGMLLGCRTIVVNLPGIEYMMPVIGRGDALFVKDVEELATRLDEAPRAQDSSYYYATPVSSLL